MERMEYDERRAKATIQLNATIATQVGRWKRTWGWLTAATVVVGIIAMGIPGFAMFTPPCILAAIIFFLLYLTARDQLREIRSRRSASPTAFISRIEEARRRHQEQQGPLHPS